MRNTMNFRLSVRSYTRRDGQTDAFREFVYDAAKEPVSFDPRKDLLEGDYKVLIFVFTIDALEEVEKVLSKFKPDGLRKGRARFLIADDLTRNKAEKGKHVIETRTPHFNLRVHVRCKTCGTMNEMHVWHDLYTDSILHLIDKLGGLDNPGSLTAFTLICGFEQAHNFMFVEEFIEGLRGFMRKGWMPIAKRVTEQGRRGIG